MAREMPGNMIYFSVFKSLREYLPGKNNNSSSSTGTGNRKSDLWHIVVDTASVIGCGAAAGMAMWTVVLPIDAAKTRIQTAWPGSTRDVGLLKQLRMMYREGGGKVLYAGLAPTLVRAAPANAAQWLVWEMMIKYGRRDENE